MGFPIGSPAVDSGRLLSQIAPDGSAWVIVGFVLAVVLLACVGLVARAFAAHRHS
jgi:hypothetical protein